MKKLLVVLVFLAVPSLAQASTLKSDGAWCWFQDPRAVYSNGKTFFGYVNSAGDIKVSRYNHSTGTVDQTANLKPAYEVDDHASPSLHLTPDGKITVFFSKHNGPEIKYRTTTNPGDLSSWGTPGAITGQEKNTYPNPVYLPGEGGGKTFLFFRGDGGLPTLTTSTNLTSWTTLRNFFDSGYPRPYVKVVGDNDQTIHFFVSKGNPTQTAHNSLYHFYYKLGYFYKSDGTLIKSVSQAASNPFTWSDVTRVYNATTNDNQAWNWDIALDGTLPVVVFATMDDNGSDHRYHRAEWTGTAWSDEELTTAGGTMSDTGEPFYSGGISLDHSDTNTVYLSRESTEGFEIEKWVRDGDWDSVNLTPSAIDKNVRPLIPRNHANPLEVIWMGGEYPHFTSFETDLRAYLID